MYCAKHDETFEPRTTSLNEELGQVDYIFSDKTGGCMHGLVLLAFALTWSCGSVVLAA